MKKGDLTTFARKTAGTSLIIIGVIGLFIPLFPDVILIIIGSSLLGSKALHKKAKKMIRRKKQKS